MIEKFENTNASISKRVEGMISKMTLEEKILQMMNNSPAIPRLNVSKYNWWNECLHGVARNGIATVFPQAIGMAASFDDELLYKVATAISDEARAKYHELVKQGDMNHGLDFWSPNINIFRDPRWGRGQETYGEDPYLTSRIGVAFVNGLQGNDPKYLKVIATPKHFAVHSGPESKRHGFDAEVSEKDLRETYLVAFKACIKEGKAASIMGAYNRVNGEPCCASPTLLQKILRDEWEFDGYVVSDCGAIDDIYRGHKLVNSPEEAAALAVRNGCDLECGQTYNYLLEAVKKGFISETEIDIAIKRLFTARFRLGMFDPPEAVRYAQIPYEINDSKAHRQLALKMAKESIVLIKNANSLLPLNKSIKSISVIGPNAYDFTILRGNYYGDSSKYVTILDGIRDKISSKTKLYYTKGCDLIGNDEIGFSEAVSMAKRSDVVIMCMGLSQVLEGEEGELSFNKEGDRKNLDLPEIQEKLVKTIYAIGKPIILVLTNGSPLTINWAQDHISAIIEAWYPGEEGGNAIADVIFGNYNPSGRLPVTFVKSIDQLPPFENYSMQGRTYRYMNEEPLYPFGYGLSYTKFEYKNLKIEPEKLRIGKNVKISIEIKNIGNQSGDEVVQLYLKDLDASTIIPHYELKGFKRIHINSGQTRRVTFNLIPRQMALIDNEGRCILEPGKFKVMIGGSQPDKRSLELTGQKIVDGEFELVGQFIEIEY
uniref:Glycoside hydrolase family 3 protein n=1 Tax=Thermodesulfobium narugense TaxID=184064 RepID=A0A7C5P7X8_9BACT